MRSTAFCLIAGLVLATTGATAQQGGGDYGRDLAGEACHGAAQTNGGTAILCGASATPSGMLHRVPLRTSLPTAEPARRSALIAAARQSPGAALQGPEAMHCADAKSLDADAVLFLCTLGVTNWPHVILVSAGQRGIALAEGLPGLMPVLEAASAEGGKTSAAQSDAALAAVKAAYPARVLAASTADYAGYIQLNNQAHSAANNGNFAGAETAYRSALDIETRLFGPDSAAVGACLLELALQVSNQQRSDEAAALFRRAAPIVEQAAGQSMRAREASYRALDAANQRNYADARKYARDAVAARQADVDAVRRSGTDINGNPTIVPAVTEGELAHDLRLEAEMAMRLGDLPGAQAAAEQALYIVTEHPDLPLSWRAEMVTLMGDINARQGRVVIAERDLTDALAMDKRLFGDGPPTIAAQLDLARFYTDEQVYPSATATFRDAFAGLAKNPVARSQLVPDQIVPFFTAAIASPADRGLDSEIFAASQLSDSGIAAQTIARVAARRAADTPALAADVRADEDAARARDELRLALAAERAKPDDERDGLREKSLAAALPGAVSTAEAAETKIRHDFPAYADLADPGAVTLAALQKALRPHEGFVGFVIGLRAGYVLLVTPTALTVKPVTATTTSLGADIADLRSAFLPRLGGLPEFSLAASAALYRQLLGPVAPQMAGIDHLIVAANGDLASLPFSLLLTRDAQARDYAHAAWLIRQTAVAQIPSARAFMALRGSAAAAAPRPFLGIGNPAFGGGGNPVFRGGADAVGAKALNALAASCQQGATADPDLLRALPPLPETATEVQTIGADLNASPDDILLGAGANETALRAKPLDQYAVLYFATHGLLPGELHCQAQPGLVLSPPQTAGLPANADGLLTASEIASLRLNARLVVLSACNTAAAGGSRFGGGALEGLADSFFDAGAHAVLASHWEVPSAATTALMTGLFANLVRDPTHDTAEALRQAQLALIAAPGTAHPFDWAAFTLIGDGA